MSETYAVDNELLRPGTASFLCLIGDFGMVGPSSTLPGAVCELAKRMKSEWEACILTTHPAWLGQLWPSHSDGFWLVGAYCSFRPLTRYGAEMTHCWGAKGTLWPRLMARRPAEAALWWPSNWVVCTSIERAVRLTMRRSSSQRGSVESLPTDVVNWAESTQGSVRASLVEVSMTLTVGGRGISL